MGEKKMCNTNTTSGVSLHSTNFTSGRGLHISSSDPSSDVFIAVGNADQQLVACDDRISLHFIFSSFSLLFLLQV